MQNSGKKGESFLKKHIITLIMWGLVLIIGGLLFSDFSKSATVIEPEKIDPYVLSTKGKTIVIRSKTADSSEKNFITVNENEKADVLVGDKVKTLDSTATIFWPDGSITRLGEKSVIKINEMRAATANEDIKVDFSLESGKTWSNVVKYMFGDSYFQERFNDDTALAAVRGTVFEINLDNNYVHTIDHSVAVKNTTGVGTGEILVVNDSIIDTKTGKAIAKSVIDAEWNKLNHDADIIYLNNRLESLKQKILATGGKANYMNAFLEKIGLRKTSTSLEVLLNGNEVEWMKFADEMKSKGNMKEVMDIYQQFYGLGNTKETLDTKMKLRDIIIEAAPEKEKKNLLNDFARSTLYDTWSMTQSGNGSSALLEEKLGEYIKQGANKTAIDALKNAAKQEELQKLDTTLQNAKDALIKTVGEKNLLEEAKKEIDTAKLEDINNKATEVRKEITDGVKNLFQ